MNPLGTPTLDPAFVIGWHVGKAAADRALAAVPGVRVPRARVGDVGVSVSSERIEA